LVWKVGFKKLGGQIAVFIEEGNYFWFKLLVGWFKTQTVKTLCEKFKKKTLTAAWVYITCLNQNIDFLKIFISLYQSAYVNSCGIFFQYRYCCCCFYLITIYALENVTNCKCNRLCYMQDSWTKQKRRATLDSCFIFHSSGRTCRLNARSTQK